MTGLTDIAVRNLKPREKRYEVCDPGASNLYLIVQPSGKKSFAVRYRHDGKSRKLTLPGGLELAAARKLASDALYEIAKGNDPAEGKKAAQQKTNAARANTVQTLCESYLKREAGNLRTGRERRRVLERLVYPSIGHVPLVDLRRSHIVALLDDIEEQCGPKMADLTLAYIRKIFGWHAIRVDDFNSPIVRGMGRYDSKKHQGKRVLTDDELRAVWQATEPNKKAPQPFYALVRFILLTGARRNEARNLPWCEIESSNWNLPAARNKVNQDLTRPLSKAAMAVLKSVPVIEGGELVFGGDRPLHLTRPLRRLKKASGTDGWRLHDLRRTARTLMSKAGVPSDHAERCLGHVLQGVRGVYDKHKFEPEMARAYEALAAVIERIVNPVADNVTPMRKRADK